MDEVDIFAGMETATEVLPAKAEIVPAKTDAEKLAAQRQERFKSIEDDILVRCTAIVQDALAFRDIEPNAEEPPEEWLKEMPYDEAKKRLRVARMAILSKKEAPVAIDLAGKMLAGIIKARATDKQGPKVLNMTFVNMEGVVPNYKEVKVE